MTIELILKIEENLVEQVQKFSNKTGIPISKLVADYFASLDPDAINKKRELTPLVESLVGSLKGSKVTVQDYWEHLEEKYL